MDHFLNLLNLSLIVTQKEDSFIFNEERHQQILVERDLFHFCSKFEMEPREPFPE